VRGAAAPNKKRERASNTHPLRFAPSQEYLGLDMKIKFLRVTAPLQRQHQIVDTVSAALLKPTRPARPYRCAHPGVHFHALHPNFPCLFALSRYECHDHGSRGLKKNLALSDVQSRHGRRRPRHL
jgi:hypothetical protein